MSRSLRSRLTGGANRPAYHAKMSERVELPTKLLTRLRGRAAERDSTGEFPAEEWAALMDAGGGRWAVPRAFGGDDLDPLALHERYETLAAASLAVALVLTQHDGAAGYLAAADGFGETLADYAAGRRLASVGISHLTTSRGGGVTASLDDGGLTLDGLVPWATAADAADDVAVAAKTGDGRQVLALVRPKTDAGVTLPPPPPIVALSATRTGTIRLDHVRLPRGRLITVGDGVLGRRGGKLPIGQAFLALGHARGAVDLIRDTDAETADRFATELADVRRRVVAHVRDVSPDPAAGDALRGETILLAQRAALAAVAVHKGAALVNDHPAQRLAREALFLLVWSCPGAVRDCTLQRLFDNDQ